MLGSVPGPDAVRYPLGTEPLLQPQGYRVRAHVGLGISLIKKGSTDSWSGSGATGAEVMVLDSMTNQVIAVAKDEKTAGFTERFSKWGSAEEAFAFWAGRVKHFLDGVHARKP